MLEKHTKVAMHFNLPLQAKETLCLLCCCSLAMIKKPTTNPLPTMLQQRFDQTPAVNHVYSPAHIETHTDTHTPFSSGKPRHGAHLKSLYRCRTKVKAIAGETRVAWLPTCFGENAAVSSLSNEVPVWELTNIKETFSSDARWEVMAAIRASDGNWNEVPI